MKKQGSALLGLVLLLVLVLAACFAVYKQLGYRYTENHGREYVKYSFECGAGKKLNKFTAGAINPLLKEKGLQELSEYDVRACGMEDAEVVRTIVITTDCTVDTCSNAVIALFEGSATSRTLRILAKYPTSEMYGSSILSSIDAWTSRSITYTVNEQAPDGPCSEEAVTQGGYSYQVVTLDLESGMRSVDETCSQRSCTDRTIICK